jgi:putative transposase
MTAYRRNSVAGGSYFFTVNLTERRLRLLTNNIELLRAAFRDTRRRHQFTIDAIVVLPDHIHAVCTLRAGDADFSIRWQLIKASFSRGFAPWRAGLGQSFCANANAGFGSAAIGSTRCGTRAILRDTSITFTLILSNTATSSECRIGRFHRSAEWCGVASNPSTGQAARRSWRAASESDDGFRRLNPSYKIHIIL